MIEVVVITLSRGWRHVRSDIVVVHIHIGIVIIINTPHSDVVILVQQFQQSLFVADPPHNNESIS